MAIPGHSPRLIYFEFISMMINHFLRDMETMAEIMIRNGLVTILFAVEKYMR